MRLAFVSPLPPAATGIADYAADVLRALAPRHAIDVFAEQEDVHRAALPAGCGLFPARALPERQAVEAYEAVVYQLGNSTAHAFQYPLMERWPGLVVLHDLVLHHARAREFLDGEAARAYTREPWREDLRAAASAAASAYRALVAADFPAQADRIVAAQLGTIGDLLPYAYTLSRAVAERARAVAVHNGAMAAALAEDAPAAAVTRVVMPAAKVPVSAEDVRQARAALGFADDHFVVGCLGLVTREKRIETVARAVARAAAAIPHVRLLLVGGVSDRAWLDAVLARTGVAERTTVAGRVPMGALAAHVEAADVLAHLRWPTARETSAALLRVLAQGRAVILSDLENFAEIPGDAVVRADVADEEGEVTRALLRLHERPALRRAMGERAAAYVAAAHHDAAVADSYDRALALASSR